MPTTPVGCTCRPVSSLTSRLTASAIDSPSFHRRPESEVEAARQLAESRDGACKRFLQPTNWLRLVEDSHEGLVSLVVGGMAIVLSDHRHTHAGNVGDEGRMHSA